VLILLAKRLKCYLTSALYLILVVVDLEEKSLVIHSLLYYNNINEHYK